MSKQAKLRYAINILFFVYFLVLLSERMISFAYGIREGLLGNNAYNAVGYSLVWASVIGFVAFFAMFCRGNVMAIAPKKERLEELDFSHLIVASGILLISGMVHTEGTIAGIQFASYGFLILAIVLMCFLKKPQNKPLLVLSVVYLVSFSMAIPVVYPSALSYATVFVIAEYAVMLTLVTSFTLLFLRLAKGEENLFSYWMIAVVVLGDGLLIGLRWQEEINVFVLIFASLSALLFLVGKIVEKAQKK